MFLHLYNVSSNSSDTLLHFKTNGFHRHLKTVHRCLRIFLAWASKTLDRNIMIQWKPLYVITNVCTFNRLLKSN